MMLISQGTTKQVGAVGPASPYDTRGSWVGGEG